VKQVLARFFCFKDFSPGFPLMPAPGSFLVAIPVLSHRARLAR
jgi:hypothetical protein